MLWLSSCHAINDLSMFHRNHNKSSAKHSLKHEDRHHRQYSKEQARQARACHDWTLQKGWLLLDDVSIVVLTTLVAFVRTRNFLLTVDFLHLIHTWFNVFIYVLHFCLIKTKLCTVFNVLIHVLHFPMSSTRWNNFDGVCRCRWISSVDFFCVENIRNSPT